MREISGREAGALLRNSQFLCMGQHSTLEKMLGKAEGQGSKVK